MSVSVSELGSADGGDVADIELEDGREFSGVIRDVFPEDGLMTLDVPFRSEKLITLRSVFGGHRIEDDGDEIGRVADVDVRSTAWNSEDVYEVLQDVEEGDEVLVRGIVTNVLGDEDAASSESEVRREFRGEVETAAHISADDRDMGTLSIYVDADGFENLSVTQQYYEDVVDEASLTATPDGGEYQMQGDVDWLERV